MDRLEDPRYWPASAPRLISTHTLGDAVRADADFLSVAALYTGDAAFNLESLIAELVTREAVPFLAPLRYSEIGLRKRTDWKATWEKQRQEDEIEAEVTQRERRLHEQILAKMHPRQAGEDARAYAVRLRAEIAKPDYAARLNNAVLREVTRRKQRKSAPFPCRRNTERPTSFPPTSGTCVAASTYRRNGSSRSCTARDARRRCGFRLRRGRETVEADGGAARRPASPDHLFRRPPA